MITEGSRLSSLVEHPLQFAPPPEAPLLGIDRLGPRDCRGAHCSVLRRSAERDGDMCIGNDLWVVIRMLWSVFNDVNDGQGIRIGTRCRPCKL